MHSRGFSLICTVVWVVHVFDRGDSSVFEGQVSPRVPWVPGSRGAARRRAVFDSRDDALDSYRGRGGFKSWPETWLEAYVRHAFVSDGDHVRLACSPEWESATFAHTEHKPWSGIRQLQCEVVALAAEQASTFSPAARERFSALLPAAEVTVVAGTTHFLPMERPDAIRDTVRQKMSITVCESQ